MVMTKLVALFRQGHPGEGTSSGEGPQEATSPDGSGETTAPSRGGAEQTPPPDTPAEKNASLGGSSERITVFAAGSQRALLAGATPEKTSPPGPEPEQAASPEAKAEKTRPPGGPGMSRRNVALAGVLGGAALFALFAWLAGSRIESPADAAARTAPPTPSPILVAIEKRVLSTRIVTRGSGRFGLPLPISISTSTLKGGPGLIGTLPIRNAPIGEGSILLTASGRPVFALRGKIPAYRDLAPGLAGDDVHQLEKALARMGYDPGPVDGSYDVKTSAAVTKLYTAKGWEPFGPTREQIATLTALERDLTDANKAKLNSRAAVMVAAPAVDSARATADHNNRMAAAELATKRTDLRKFGIDATRGVSAAVETERMKADFAYMAAEAELKAAVSERALINLDPRQPNSARAAAEARVALALAAANKAKLEGEAAVQAARSETTMLPQRIELAQGAVESVRLEGEKSVRAAIDTLRAAELEAKLADERVVRLTSELELARRKMGVQVPVDEIVFIPSLPVRVEEIKGIVGTAAMGHVLSVTDNQLVVDAALPLEAAGLVRPGMPVEIDEQALGIKARGVVSTVANTPGTMGVDGYHFYLEVQVLDPEVKMAGVSVRLNIPVESTKGAVMAVPSSALSLSADGTSRIQVQGKDGLEYVVVKPGLVADGFVEVTPVQGTLAAGQKVVVGYKMSEQLPDTVVDTAAPK
jgi:Putative peptidoglycan binding domain